MLAGFRLRGWVEEIDCENLRMACQYTFMIPTHYRVCAKPLREAFDALEALVDVVCHSGGGDFGSARRTILAVFASCADYVILFGVKLMDRLSAAMISMIVYAIGGRLGWSI